MLAAFLTKPAECIGRMDGQELWHAAFLDASYIDIYAKLYIGLSAVVALLEQSGVVTRMLMRNLSPVFMLTSIDLTRNTASF